MTKQTTKEGYLDNCLLFFFERFLKLPKHEESLWIIKNVGYLFITMVVPGNSTHWRLSSWDIGTYEYHGTRRHRASKSRVWVGLNFVPVKTLVRIFVLIKAVSAGENHHSTFLQKFNKWILEKYFSHYFLHESSRRRGRTLTIYPMHIFFSAPIFTFGLHNNQA